MGKAKILHPGQADRPAFVIEKNTLNRSAYGDNWHTGLFVNLPNELFQSAHHCTAIEDQCRDLRVLHVSVRQAVVVGDKPALAGDAQMAFFVRLWMIVLIQPDQYHLVIMPLLQQQGLTFDVEARREGEGAWIAVYPLDSLLVVLGPECRFVVLYDVQRHPVDLHVPVEKTEDDVPVGVEVVEGKESHHSKYYCNNHGYFYRWSSGIRLFSVICINFLWRSR